MGELVAATEPGALLTRHAVTELLERGKDWLRLALERDTEIRELVDYKAEASVLRELTIQKELGKDAELAATELVRRAEKAIAGAIRKGQEVGRVGSREHPTLHGKRGFTRANGTAVAPINPPVHDVDRKVSPYEAAGGVCKGTLDQYYDLNDGVTPDQFDAAIEAARTEGKLTRANVIRKIRGQATPSTSRPAVLRGTRRFDSTMVLERTVQAAADVITPSLLAEVNYGELETVAIQEWISSLGDSIKALNSLKAHLNKELTHR